MTHKFNIALIQLALNGTPEQNLQKSLAGIRAAAEKGGQVVCLPELYRSFYFCQKEDPRYFELAEPLQSASFDAFSETAKALGIVIVVPFFERRAPGLYHNSAVIFDADGRQAGLYRKMHIPDDPGFYEKYYFAPGDLGFKAVATAFGPIGVLICWDQWYPEAARIAALHGARVLFYPTAIGWHPHEKQQHGARQLEAWMTVQRGHAIANGVYVAAVNRTGFEQPEKDQAGLEFWGSSFIAGPQGELIARAGTDREEILTAEFDPAEVENVRRNWPFLRDRRIDAYGDILKRFAD
jgi:N-carbamoylputrescine amidase